MAWHNKDQNPERIHGTGSSKVDVYDWEVLDEKGRFEEIHKGQLRIDPAYQREFVSNSRILEIARNFQYKACLTLGVARRPDGSPWVFDGQTRKCAADRRSDLTLLPCMVWDVSDKKWEALAFLAIQCARGPVKSTDKFKAMLIADDATALAVKAMVEETGYEVSSRKAQFTVSCVGALMNAYKVNPCCARTAWRLSSELFSGDVVTDFVFGGLFYLEQFLAKRGVASPAEAYSLTDRHNKESLLSAGVEIISRSINETRAYYKKGGAKVYAEGIVQLLNRRRRTRKLPSVFGTGEDES